MTFPELYDDSHPEALARNTQKIFRWLDKDTPDAVEKMQALLPAIEKAMPPLLVARMRSHSSEYYREIVERRDRLVKDVDDFVASAVVFYEQQASWSCLGRVRLHRHDLIQGGGYGPSCRLQQ